MSRALATIETIVAVEEHPNAQMLEIVQVRGWRCVVRKADEFQVGQPVLYLEVDSHLDVEDARFAFLAKGGMKTNAAGWKGHRLKTVKLRGELSQGLVMPLDDFPELLGRSPGDDVTAALPVRLWEPPIPMTAGDIIGPFPDGVPKTDEERIQNLSAEELAEALSWSYISITEKLDGMSVTAVMKDDGSIAVASRNYEVSAFSTAYTTVVTSPAGEWLMKQVPGVFLQGELIGPSIQGNPLKLTKPEWRLFTVGFISEYREARRVNPVLLLPPDVISEQMVPALPPGTINRYSTTDELIGYADGIVSMLNQGSLAEGIVIRGYDDSENLRSSFKVLNNTALLKEK